MKDELIKILNFKLKHITDNIEELNIINEKIDNEDAKLKYIQDAIDNFKAEKHGFDIYKFAKITRENFNKLLMELSDEVLTSFGTNSCNYDGLIYLINGINSGISLTLTKEQTEAINLFIDKLLEKEKYYQESVASLNLSLQKLEIQDLSVLKELENKYSVIIDNIENKRYVMEVDEVVRAILYSELSSEKTFDILCYLLKYNSDIYNTLKEEQEKKIVSTLEKEETIDLTKPFVKETFETTFLDDDNVIEKNMSLTGEEKDKDVKSISFEADDEEKNSEEETKIDLSFEKTMEVPNFDYLNKLNLEPTILPVTNVLEESLENAIASSDLEDDKVLENENTNTEEYEVFEYNPVLPPFENDNIEEQGTLDSKIDNQEEVETDEDFDSNLELPEVELADEELEKKEEEITKAENTLETVEQTTDKNDDLALKQMFDDYRIDYDKFDEVTKAMLLKGNVESFKNILDKLKDLDVLNYLKTRMQVLIQILVYSSVEIIEEICGLIEGNLLVDSKDKKYTIKLSFETMPTIFLKSDNGHYNNFVKNVEILKEYGIDLINLFYSSREIFVADSKLIENNYRIIRSYDLTVNDTNAKYLLLIPNINEKIDYYVESVYKDNSKEGNNETFEGIDLIKLYPSKLNTVNSETIKRLRYSSENGRKIFGSKEKSLAVEITNLKVDVINMGDEYKKSFFNNEFDIIPSDEVLKFSKLVNIKNFVELNVDEFMNKLEAYREGLRYNVEGIHISRNKVIRNYNILVNNGVSSTKALLFAMCYNSVITKEEYDKVKNFVNGLGGN